MHLGLTTRQRALIAAVRDFAADWVPLTSEDSEYFAALCARGWSAPGWPAPWGGGLDAMESYLVERTLVQAGAPLLDPGTLQHAGPMLLALADEELCQRYLPGLAARRARWAVHGSILGAPPLPGRFRDDGIEFDSSRTVVYGASAATAVLLLVADGDATVLTVAELADAAVLANQPLDPDTVDLSALSFEVLATSHSHSNLARALALRGEVAAGFVQYSTNCWTPRLRYQLERLEMEDPAARGELAELAVALAGVEAMEQRALSAADSQLQAAVAIRCAELGRAMAGIRIDRLGYYALPAPDPTLQHNELPAQGLAAQDAIAELIRYLEGDFGFRRDNLARNLGIVTTPDAPD